MGIRGWWLVGVFPALVLCACGDDDDDGDSSIVPPDGSGGPIADGGRPRVEDAGPFDCSLSDADGELLVELDGPPVPVRGKLRGAALPAPLPGEPELEVMRGPDSQLAGATVSLRKMDGTVVSRDQTGCDGTYVLLAPAESQVFIVVDAIDGPAGGYPGYIESRYVEADGLEQWDMWPLITYELEWRLSMLGEAYDRSTGWIVQSFSSTRRPGGGLDGGEGLSVNGTDAGPSFVVTGTRTIETNVLPPECDDDVADGVERGEPVTNGDGDVVCYTDLLEMIFVSGVEPGRARLELVDPPGKRCTQREDVPQWVVQANSVSRVRADCE